MARQPTVSNIDVLKQQRDDLQTQAKRLAEAIGLGGDLQSLIQRLRTVESEIKKLDYALAAYRRPSLKVTAEQVREHVLKVMMQLRTALNETGAEVAIARNALRKHVGRLVLSPTIKDGRNLFRVSGNVNPLPEVGEGGMLLVARDGIEPPTPAFSGLLSAAPILLN